MTTALDYTRPAPTSDQEPIPQLERLERLLGTWRISGDVAGCVSFEWMVGGYFLVQHIELFEAGTVQSGVAYIGYEPERDTLRAIYFGSNESPLEYDWEMNGDEIAIPMSGGIGHVKLERFEALGDTAVDGRE